MNTVKKIQRWIKKRVAIGDLKRTYAQSIECLVKEMAKQELIIVENHVVCDLCLDNCGQCQITRRQGEFQKHLDDARTLYYQELNKLEGK